MLLRLAQQVKAGIALIRDITMCRHHEDLSAVLQSGAEDASQTSRQAIQAQTGTPCIMQGSKDFCRGSGLPGIVTVPSACRGLACATPAGS